MVTKWKIAVLAVALPGLATVLLSDNAGALGNPSYTVINTTSSVYDYVTDSRCPYSLCVYYDTALTAGPPGLIELGVASIDLPAGATYHDGVNLTCSQSGLHNTGWLGPYTKAYPTGSQGLFCTFGSSDKATTGTGAAYM